MGEVIPFGRRAQGQGRRRGRRGASPPRAPGDARTDAVDVVADLHALDALAQGLRMEVGQPSSAFDADDVAELGRVVRASIAGLRREACAVLDADVVDDAIDAARDRALRALR